MSYDIAYEEKNGKLIVKCDRSTYKDIMKNISGRWNGKSGGFVLPIEKKPEIIALIEGVRDAQVAQNQPDNDNEMNTRFQPEEEVKVKIEMEDTSEYQNDTQFIQQPQIIEEEEIKKETEQEAEEETESKPESDPESKPETESDHEPYVDLEETEKSNSNFEKRLPPVTKKFVDNQMSSLIDSDDELDIEFIPPKKVESKPKAFKNEPIVSKPKQKVIEHEPFVSKPKQKVIEHEPMVSKPKQQKVIEHEPTVSKPKQQKVIEHEPMVSKPKQQKVIEHEPMVSKPKQQKVIEHEPMVSKPKQQKVIEHEPMVSKPKQKVIEHEPTVSKPKQKVIEHEPTVSKPKQQKVIEPMVSEKINKRKFQTPSPSEYSDVDYNEYNDDDEYYEENEDGEEEEEYGEETENDDSSEIYKNSLRVQPVVYSPVKHNKPTKNKSYDFDRDSESFLNKQRGIGFNENTRKNRSWLENDKNIDMTHSSKYSREEKDKLKKKIELLELKKAKKYGKPIEEVRAERKQTSMRFQELINTVLQLQQRIEELEFQMNSKRNEKERYRK
jgi:hypothetical protein